MFFRIFILSTFLATPLFSLSWTTSGHGNYQAINGPHTYNYKANTTFTHGYVQTILDGALNRTTIDTETSSQAKWSYDYTAGSPEDDLGSFGWLITDPKGGNGFTYKENTHQFSPNFWTMYSSSGSKRESGIWTFNATTMTWSNNYTNASWRYDKSTKTWHSFTGAIPGTGEIQWKYDTENDLWLFQPNAIDWYTLSGNKSLYNHTNPSSPWYNTPVHERWFSWKLHDQFVWEYHHTDELNGIVSSDLKCVTIVDSRTGAAHCKPYTTFAGCSEVVAPRKNPAKSTAYTRWFVPRFNGIVRELAELNTQTPYYAFSGSGSFISGYVRSWTSLDDTKWSDQFLTQRGQLSIPISPNAPPSYLWKTNNFEKVPPDYFVLPPLVVTMHQEFISTYLSLQEALSDTPRYAISSPNGTIYSYFSETPYFFDGINPTTAPLSATFSDANVTQSWFYDFVAGAPTGTTLGSFVHTAAYDSGAVSITSYYDAGSSLATDARYTPIDGNPYQRATWSYDGNNTSWSNTLSQITWTHDEATNSWEQSIVAVDGSNTHTAHWNYDIDTRTWTNLSTNEQWSHPDSQHWIKINGSFTPSSGSFDEIWNVSTEEPQAWLNLSPSRMPSNLQLNNTSELIAFEQTNDPSYTPYYLAPISSGMWGEYASISDVTNQTPHATWSLNVGGLHGIWMRSENGTITTYTYNESEQRWEDSSGIIRHVPTLLPPQIVTQHAEIMIGYTEIQQALS